MGSKKTIIDHLSSDKPSSDTTTNSQGIQYSLQDSLNLLITEEHAICQLKYNCFMPLAHTLSHYYIPHADVWRCETFDDIWCNALSYCCTYDEIFPWFTVIPQCYYILLSIYSEGFNWSDPDMSALSLSI